MKAANTRVLITGAGPTGLTLACLLQQAGVSYKIIDKRSTQSTVTRAIGVSNSTLETFEQFGITKQLMQDGLQVQHTTLYWQGKRLINVNYKYTAMRYPFFLYITQPQIEKFLVDKLRLLNGQIERNVCLKTLESHDKEIVTQSILPNGERVTEKFNYVVGCDGSNSLVREQAGIAYDTEEYGAYFLLADVTMKWSNQDNNAHYFIDDNGYLMIIPLPGGMYRIIASFHGSFSKDKVDSITLNSLQTIINKRSSRLIELQKIIWSTGGPFLHKIAKSCRKGNILLAGDAFHIFSPVGGTNMNAGIQDAVNLAEKIIAIEKHNANPAILDDYGRERYQFIESNLQATRQATFSILQHSQRNTAYDNYFLPRMNNRHFIRHILPMQFSGLPSASKAALFTGENYAIN